MKEKDFEKSISAGLASSDYDALTPENRWAARAETYRAAGRLLSLTQAPSLSPDECAAMAWRDDITLVDWIKITGVGMGTHGAYEINKSGVLFIPWTDYEVATAPLDFQVAMLQDNETSSLSFPCCAQELGRFVRSALGIHCFSLPDAFNLCLLFLAAEITTTEGTANHDFAVTKSDLLDGLQLPAKWKEILTHQKANQKRIGAALLQPGKRGRQQGGGSAESLWNAVVFTRLLVEAGELNRTQAVARFNKRWPEWEDALAGEMGEIYKN